MSGAVLLDRKTGKAETRHGELLGPSGFPLSIERNVEAGWRPWRSENELAKLIDTNLVGRVPDSVLENLEKARAGRQQAGDRSMRFNPLNAGNFYNQPISWILADGTQILNTTTETIMVPSFTIQAGTLSPGSVLRYTVFGEVSFNATPGTLTLRLRAGGAGGTSLAASGAYAPGGGGLTTRGCMVTYLITCRSIGTTGTVFVQGYWTPPQFDNTSATTLQGNLQMLNIPVSGPATATVNTTIANTLDPTAQFSVTTATTQWTSHLSLLESVA